MAQRRGQQNVEVSLFSFMDIMTCVIGIIILVLVGLLATYGRGEMAGAVEKSSAVQEKLKELQDRAESLSRQHEDIRAARERIEDSIEAAKQSAGYSQTAALDDKVIDLTINIEQLEQERSVLKKRIQETQAQLEEKQEDVNDPRRVWLLPATEHAARKTPILYVCGPGGVDRLGADARWPVRAGFDGRFAKELRGVTVSKSKFYIVFLIRPDGIEVFNSAMRLTKAFDIEVGYEPVSADWKLTVPRRIADK